MRSINGLLMDATYNIEELEQQIGGLFSGSRRFGAGCDEPKMTFRTPHLGDIGQVWAHLKHNVEHRSPFISLDGGGTGLSDGEALLPSLAEGLERYCTTIFSPEQFVSASAEELGEAALDLSTIPVCSTTERAHPLCPLGAPDKKAPIRWVQAVSLLDGRLTYVPAVMVYLFAGYATPGERFWTPITTGCAAHRSYERALVGAILEVIERDALSVLWLQQLPLPRVEIDRLPPSVAGYWDSYQRASAELEYVFFDATTDLGVPTIYSVQMSRANKRVMSLVSCSTCLDPFQAVGKVMRDMGSCRIPFRAPKPIPANWDHFTDLFHGAGYMARAEQAGAFDFLLKSRGQRALSSMPCLDTADDNITLRGIVDRFRQRGWDIYVVDLTTDEALRTGFRVVRVIVPALQPFSFHYRARYLGHPRLYEAPRSMGYPVRGEADINPWPQPFS
jgi:ribosomal protein S12 methylthiotransferase accessory factor